MDSRQSPSNADPPPEVFSSTSTSAPVASSIPSGRSTSERQAKDGRKRRKQKARIRSRTDSRTFASFPDLHRRISEISPTQGEVDIASGFSGLKKRYESGTLDQQWTEEQFQSVMPDTLDTKLVSQFEDDLKAATTLLLECVRDDRLAPSKEEEIGELTSKITKGGRKTDVEQPATSIDPSATVVSRMDQISGSNKSGKALAGDLGTLFRAILPEEHSRRSLSVRLKSLAMHAGILGLKNGSQATVDVGITSPYRTADGTGATEDFEEILWNTKVEKFYELTEVARELGKAALIKEAAKLRKSISRSLSKQSLYGKYLKDNGSDTGLHVSAAHSLE